MRFLLVVSVLLKLSALLGRLSNTRPDRGADWISRNRAYKRVNPPCGARRETTERNRIEMLSGLRGIAYCAGVGPRVEVTDF
jgi:hypothetical protein